MGGCLGVEVIEVVSGVPLSGVSELPIVYQFCPVLSAWSLTVVCILFYFLPGGGVGTGGRLALEINFTFGTFTSCLFLMVLHLGHVRPVTTGTVLGHSLLDPTSFPNQLLFPGLPPFL